MSTYSNGWVEVTLAGLNGGAPSEVGMSVLFLVCRDKPENSTGVTRSLVQKTLVFFFKRNLTIFSCV